MVMMSNMYVIEELCLSLSFRLCFNSRGVSLYEEPISPALQEFSWLFFPSTLISFYRERLHGMFFTVKTFWIKFSCSGLVHGEKTQTLKKARCLSPVVIDESCSLD